MNIIADIRQELKGQVDVLYRDGAVRFFNEPIECYGVRTPIVRKIANRYWQEIKGDDKKQVFQLSEELYASNLCEETTIATQWVRKFSKEYELSDFKIFERWISKYFNNWAKIDDFCTHPMHDLIEKYPELIPNVKGWVNSNNRWVRRAAAVSFITSHKSFYVTKGNLETIFWIAEKLMMDQDDLVQKGYGWMLKAASHDNQKAVHDFVMNNKDQMPRTALRYAIEKMPQKLKQQAMS
ncbi:MAG: DNA alkylation repair protein [Candidatus Uhrbacteria bacterium]